MGIIATAGGRPRVRQPRRRQRDQDHGQRLQLRQDGEAARAGASQAQTRIVAGAGPTRVTASDDADRYDQHGEPAHRRTRGRDSRPPRSARMPARPAPGAGISR